MTDRSRVVHSNPEILGGPSVFVGTRVPLQNLIDYLEAGDRTEERALPGSHRAWEEQTVLPMSLD